MKVSHCTSSIEKDGINAFWCKCVSCRYTLSGAGLLDENDPLSRSILEMKGYLPPPIPIEAKIEICPFCQSDGVCGQDHCPYTRKD